MKMVWVLVRGKNPVLFWAGSAWKHGAAWSTDESDAATFKTAGEAREFAYNMLQASCQDTIVAEGVYRKGGAR